MNTDQDHHRQTFLWKQQPILEGGDFRGLAAFHYTSSTISNNSNSNGNNRIPSPSDIYRHDRTTITVVEMECVRKNVVDFIEWNLVSCFYLTLMRNEVLVVPVPVMTRNENEELRYVKEKIVSGRHGFWNSNTHVNTNYDYDYDEWFNTEADTNDHDQDQDDHPHRHHPTTSGF